MCSSDAEPFCINSESIMRCTEERLKRLEKKAAVLTRRTQFIENDYQQEEDDFQSALISLVQFLKEP